MLRLVVPSSLGLILAIPGFVWHFSYLCGKLGKWETLEKGVKLPG